MDAVTPGYKLTDAGVIPEGWEVTTLSQLTLGGSKNGYSGRVGREGSGTLTLKLSATTSGVMDINDETVKRLAEIVPTGSDLYLERGDVLIQRSNTFDLVGMAAVYCGPYNTYIYPDLMMRLRFRNPVTAQYFWRYANSDSGRRFFQSIAAGSTGSMPKISGVRLSSMPVPLPPLAEQRAIAAALGDLDRLIVASGRGVAKRRDLKQAAMQQLLTGRTRLPGFADPWVEKRIADVATPSTARNFAAESLPVLSCSKHLGFVDSLKYFKNQVFSDDTSGYRVIRRGELGYPANHIEEGSIGLQDLYDVALVSPIYVVFGVHDCMNSYFLHRLLKLETYRAKFSTATSSSVDRRGSLRWAAFSEIKVTVPPLPEQQAIAAVLADFDAELEALEAERAKWRLVKQGAMQDLLTGRTRLV